jgi:hypothetical protein
MYTGTGTWLAASAGKYGATGCPAVSGVCRAYAAPAGFPSVELKRAGGSLTTPIQDARPLPKGLARLNGL